MPWSVIRKRPPRRAEEWPAGGLYRITPRGERVYLRKSTWFFHIVQSHPEMQNCLEALLETIREPEAIYRTKTGRKTYLCYRFSERRGMWVVVIYGISGETGSIRTAYQVRNPATEVKGLNRAWPHG